MQPTALAAPTTPNPVSLIPSPDTVRIAISEKYAEIAVLRRLLKASEAKARLCPARREVAGAS
jgi:hypothetical protein